MIKTIITYLVSIFLGLLIISGGQFVIFILLSLLDRNFIDSTIQPKWFDDTLPFQEKADLIIGYLSGFSFLTFWGLTLVFIICKVISLIPKPQLIDRFINGFLTFAMTLIISIGFGYYSSLDNLSILLTALLGLVFGSTILTQRLRRDSNTYA